MASGFPSGNNTQISISPSHTDMNLKDGVKNRPLWYIMLDYFLTRPSFKNLNVAFFCQSGHRF